MLPVAPYPASLADINYAIRWLKTRAAEVGSHPDVVGVMGTSSGAHQAMLAAMRPRDPRYRKAGGQIELELYEGEPEGFARNPGSPSAAQAIGKIIEFVHKQSRYAGGLSPRRVPSRGRGAWR